MEGEGGGQERDCSQGPCWPVVCTTLSSSSIRRWDGVTEDSYCSLPDAVPRTMLHAGPDRGTEARVCDAMVLSSRAVFLLYHNCCAFQDTLRVTSEVSNFENASTPKLVPHILKWTLTTGAASVHGFHLVPHVPMNSSSDLTIVWRTENRQHVGITLPRN